MTSTTYVRYELVRVLRNRRFFLFSLGFPLVLYFLVAGPNRDVHDLGGSGVSAPLYFMIGLTAFGAMNSVIAGGARIAFDRSVGWTRQLRLTPLSPRSYLVTKILTAYLTALITVVVLAAAGASLGVHLSASVWAETIALLLIGLLPFAALGILFGHLLTVDSLGPAVGGTTALLAFLGGVWFPIQSGFMHTVAQALPSYWLVQASRVATGGHAWGVRGWAITVAWTIVLGAAAAWAYRRDTERA
ncbi:MAG TPA: ABC transporter permease [Gaiellaceae bacterium]|nr:ABC transporter permease [Gaiellaceae bacterium]